MEDMLHNDILSYDNSTWALKAMEMTLDERRKGRQTFSTVNHPIHEAESFASTSRDTTFPPITRGIFLFLQRNSMQKRGLRNSKLLGGCFGQLRALSMAK